MAIRFIALDIDGTLLNSHFEVSGVNATAIEAATERGVEVALVTGRRYDFAMPVATQVHAPLTMIVNNGALVRTKDGQTLRRHLLPRDTARKVIQATETWRNAAVVVFDRPKANQLILESIDWSDPARGRYYQRNREFMATATPLESCLVEDPLQVMYTGSVDAMQEAQIALRHVQLAEEFNLASTVYADRDFAMLDVIRAGVTKGTTLAQWTASRGIAPEEILAIGDNHNDLEMLSFAGTPVVMENSVPELKQRGWHVTRSNDEDGVAAAIERFALLQATE